MLRFCDCYSRMSGIKNVFLVVVTFLFSPPARGDEEVSCVFMESCILPCGFQAGDHILIHWIQVTAGKVPVHSYYYNQDQLFHQNQRFRDRTSLFNDQISRGNASLLLKGVEVQDQGRYKCYTNTITGNKETFINLKVDAPVSTTISSLTRSDSAASSRRASLRTLYSSTNVAGIVGGVVGPIWCVLLIGLGVYCVRNRTAARDPENPEPSEGILNPAEDILLNERENGGE